MLYSTSYLHANAMEQTDPQLRELLAATFLYRVKTTLGSTHVTARLVSVSAAQITRISELSFGSAFKLHGQVAIETERGFFQIDDTPTRYAVIRHSTCDTPELARCSEFALEIDALYTRRNDSPQAEPNGRRPKADYESYASSENDSTNETN